MQPSRVRVVHQRRSVEIEALPSWNVLFLRQVAATQLGLDSCSSCDLSLILAGRALPDHMDLGALRLAEATVLHLVARPPGAVPEAEPSPSCDPQDDWRRWRRFFVFCRSCADLHEARLRLHCGLCGSGAFLLPSPVPPVHSFAQLSARRVTGRCPDCASDVAPMGFAFRCEADRSEDAAGHVVVPLPLMRDSWRAGGYECSACLERPAGPLLHFPCAPEHCMCVPCFRQYTGEAMTAGRFRLFRGAGWSVGCPHGCVGAAVDDPHHFLLLGTAFYSAVKERGAEAVVSHAGGGFCPNRECGEAWMPPAVRDGRREVACHACGCRICLRCRESAHPDSGECGEPAEDEPEAREALELEVPFRPPSPSSLASQRTIRSVARRCPGCQAQTEKDGGCMHITCSRCGFQWCWICRCEWTADCRGAHWFG